MLTRVLRSLPWLGLSLALFVLLAALPVWTGPGLVNTRGGGDSPFLFFRLQQLVTNLREGVFPARWMPDAAYGLGYPFFSYYAALPYYLGALFNLIGFDVLVSIKLVQTLGFGLAAWGMYRWADRHTPARSAAWLIAVAYTFAPFHLINVYVRGDSLSEFYAFVFYPLILLSIDRVLESPRAFAWLALSYGGLIMTHNVSALIFSPFVVVYGLLRGVSARVMRSTWLALIGGLLLSFALSAWFWLPALGEANLVQLDNQTTGYFNYAEHFRAANLIQTSIGFDYSITADPQSSTPFAMGLVQAIGTGAGLIVLIATWRRARDRSFRGFVVLGLIVSTLMITPLSKVLWDTLPLLPLTQFPWRFLSIQAVFAALMIGQLITHHAPRTTLLTSLVGVALAAAVLLPLRPDYLPLRADEITPARLQLYEAFTGNIGTTIRAEYLPRTTLPRPYTGPILSEPSTVPSRALVLNGTAAMTQQARQTARQVWSAQVESERATLAVPLLYWPGWTATIDGQTTSISAVPDLGYVQIEVPQGAHQIVLELGRTPLRVGAEWVSLMALLGVLVWGGWSQRSARRMNSTAVSTSRLKPTALALGGVIVSVLLGVFVLSGRAVEADSPLSMDFADKPWLHHNPGGIDFGDARLLAYTVAVADHVILSTTWQIIGTEPLTMTVALVAPSTHFLGGPSPIVEQMQAITSGTTTYDLALPYTLPTGMYYLRLKSATREEYLAPVWIKSQTEVDPAAFGKLTPSIGLAAAHTRLLNSDHLDVRLTWTVSGAIDANYSLALRLHDAAASANGKVWTSLDTQPGYGFQPTSAWQAGTLNDVYTLNVPADAPRDQRYALDVILYRRASQSEVGRTTIDGLRLDQTAEWRSIEPPARNFTLPMLTNTLAVDYGDQIRLAGYEMAQADRTVTLNLAWLALRDIDRNYKVFVHVFDLATEKIVAQSDVMPRNNAYPTSRWLQGEVITDAITLSLTDAPAGAYHIAIGLFDESGRLPISGASADVANQRVVLDDVIEVR